MRRYPETRDTGYGCNAQSGQLFQFPGKVIVLQFVSCRILSDAVTVGRFDDYQRWPPNLFNISMVKDTGAIVTTTWLALTSLIAGESSIDVTIKNLNL